MTARTSRTSIELCTLPSVSPADPQLAESIPPTRAASVHDSPSTSDVEQLSEDASTERNVSALHPVDRGVRAWRFLAAATLIETTVWGLPFTIGVLHQYWATYLFPGEESTLTLTATLQTGLMYMSTAVLGP